MVLLSSPADKPRILVVDDEPTIRDMLGEFLELEGYRVDLAQDGMEALNFLDRHDVQLVLADLKMPKVGGLAMLEQMQERHTTTAVVIMTGFGTVETAIDCMKRGAHDYLLKPFKLDQVLDVVARAIDKSRLENENLRLRQAVSLYQVSESISASLSLEEVLSTVVTTSQSELHADWVALWLKDEHGTWFERESRRSERAASGSIDIGELDAALVSARLDDGPVLLHHEDTAQVFVDRRTAPLTSFVAVALTEKQRMLGMVAAASLVPGRRFEEGQRRLLSIVASRAAAAIENSRLFQNLQETFHQTIEGLASAIDKMDRYTAGHSTRVAQYAMFLGKRAGLGPEDIEVVRQSALLHDIGKIGCVLNLNKPGKLSDAEYEVFKRHPGYGRDILAPIRFLQPLVPGVYLHHERFDGHGYPLGLAGEKIPMIARIISVADTYDAMTSTRSYRRALPHEVAVAEIERCSGSQFDPGVAETFLTNLDAYREELLAKGERVPF